MRIPNVGARVTLPGEDYTIWFRKIPIHVMAEVQDQTGFTLVTLANACDEFDVKALRALVWLCRALAGVPQSTVENVMFEIGDIEVDRLEPPAEPDPTTPKTSEDGEPATSESSATSSVSDPTPSTV